MDLEGVLRGFGATADFWATSKQTDAAAERNPAWEEVELLVKSLPNGEGRALLSRIVDDRLRGDKPLYESLAEIYTEKGDTEAAAKAYEKVAEAASKAHEALLKDYSNPQDLCWLGYLLLQRCDVDELPLCADHFNWSVIDFGNNDTLVVSHFPFSDAAVQEFANEPETLRLATRAFGLAWLYYYKYKQSEKKSDAWQALPALDGMRVAFFHGDNLEALQAVVDTFYEWVENWDFGTGLCCDEFVANFRATDAYLLGRRKAPAVGGPDLLETQRLIIWQLKELLSEVRAREMSSQDMELLAAGVSEAVAQRLGRIRSYKVEALEAPLAREFADRWMQLPRAVQRLIKQAEYVRSVFQDVVDADWAPVVVQYIRAAETLLRRLGEQLDAKKVHEKLNNGYPLAKANIEGFRNLFQKPQFVQFAEAAGVANSVSIATLGPELDGVVRNYRNPAVHGPEPTSPVKGMELRDFLLETKNRRVGLLWKINALCTSD